MILLCVWLPQKRSFASRPATGWSSFHGRITGWDRLGWYLGARRLAGLSRRCPPIQDPGPTSARTKCPLENTVSTSPLTLRTSRIKVRSDGRIKTRAISAATLPPNCRIEVAVTSPRSPSDAISTTPRRGSNCWSLMEIAERDTADRVSTLAKNRNSSQ